MNSCFVGCFWRAAAAAGVVVAIGIVSALVLGALMAIFSAGVTAPIAIAAITGIVAFALTAAAIVFAIALADCVLISRCFEQADTDRDDGDERDQVGEVRVGIAVDRIVLAGVVAYLIVKPELSVFGLG